MNAIRRFLSWVFGPRQVILLVVELESGKRKLAVISKEELCKAISKLS